MNRLRPAKAGLIEFQASKICGGSAATATASALLMFSQASIGVPDSQLKQLRSSPDYKSQIRE